MTIKTKKSLLRPIKAMLRATTKQNQDQDHPDHGQTNPEKPSRFGKTRFSPD
jgi:hypothetical protein